MMALTLVSAAVLAFLVGLAWFTLRCPTLRTAAGAATSDRVTILVPARDEAATIEHTVRCALAQEVASLEVLVVDDGSRDQTPRILARLAREDPRLRVLQGRPRPEGWNGKANALDHASRHARGGWLLFADADAELAPGAVAAAIAAARREQATFLSVWPRQRAVGFWERQVQPVVIAVTASADALRRALLPGYPAGFSAWGLFILVRADAYRRVGGHAAVWDRVLEDTELCRAFRRAGEQTVIFRGGALVRVRMYEGFRELWRGWRKSLYPSLGHDLATTLAAASFVLAVTCGPLAGTITAIVRGDAMALVPWVGLLALQTIGGGALASRIVEVSPRFGISPLGGALYAALLVDSAVRHRSPHGVSWKGRRYVDPERR